mgnify:CR=1 FL=1
MRCANEREGQGTRFSFRLFFPGFLVCAHPAHTTELLARKSALEKLNSTITRATGQRRPPPQQLAASSGPKRPRFQEPRRPMGPGAGYRRDRRRGGFGFGRGGGAAGMARPPREGGDRPGVGAARHGPQGPTRG